MPPSTTPRAARRLLPVAAAAVLAAVTLSTTATAAPVGTVAPPDPASGLRLLSTGEAGHETVPVAAGQDGLPFQADTTIEPSIGVNPANPKEIVTGFQTGRDDAGGGIDNGFATSHDGGVTWVSGAMPGLTATAPSPNSAYTRASDAVISWGLGDTVYYSSLVFDPSGANLRSAIVNSTSHDGGLTWGQPDIVQDDPGAGLNDKNWVVVDRSNAAGHHQGRIYVVWDRVAGVFTKYSDDDGKTWVPPSPVLVPNTFGGQGISAIPLVLPSGALSVILKSETAGTPVDELAQGQTPAGTTTFVAATAPLAGTTVSPAPVAFGPAIAFATFQGVAVRGQRAGGLVAADVDPATGRIYATFESAATRTDGVVNDVVVTHSDDSGTTWTTPVRVNGGPKADLVDHYDPYVAVGPGSVRVMWRQRQEATGAPSTFSPYISTWVAQSTDGGTTFAPPLQVDRGTNDVAFAAFSRGGTFQGDYDQLVTVGTTSYLVYCDSGPATAGETQTAAPSATTVHHQRAIVSIVQPAGATGVPPTTVPEQHLPVLGLLGAVATAGGAALVVVRRRRTQPQG